MNTPENIDKLHGQPVIAGSSIAGLLIALHMQDAPCIVVSSGENRGCPYRREPLPDPEITSKTFIARSGGTLACGDGLCLPETVQLFADSNSLIQKDMADFIPAELREKNGNGEDLRASLLDRVRQNRNITLLSPAVLTGITKTEGRVTGVSLRADERSIQISTDAVILASGGVTSVIRGRQPETCGISLALRAGAHIRDPEFIHFHPLTFTEGQEQIFVPENVSAETIFFSDEKNHPLFFPVRDRPALARAVWRQTESGHRVYLDLSEAAADPRHLTNTTWIRFMENSRRAGRDLTVEKLPVTASPAFHTGGILVDTDGRSSVPGLWACGEIASTGLHGADYLPGNAFLEALLFSRRVAQNVLIRETARFPLMNQNHTAGVRPHGLAGLLQRLSYVALSPVRSAKVLELVISKLAEFVSFDDAALLVTTCCLGALRRQESRGCHYRMDFPSGMEEAKHSDFALPFILKEIARIRNHSDSRH
ncbi:FAD-binding protein [Acetobacter sp. AN02]|uniref:FAD-binding protein n=1 Tax=Acetobacter sp. AN02 TaxID=2894186 RepID=UPI0024342293|nr:FAD-binding protein [Acetobacter sp. AN02]MDG6093792.1 FAD-binding protein [Acetobacter sp. AN02]